MPGSELFSGYLDVKISSKSRRGFTPWKAWQRQWCEIRRIDNVVNGMELKLKSVQDGSVLKNIVLPRSATICRTESRTKQYAFGVFTLGRNQKPLIFLSGSSENNSQEWMESMRRMLCVASYLPVGHSNFRVSLVDNSHSRSAGLIGLHGVLGTNAHGIVISDPCTGEAKVTWKWYQFHQFHLQAPVHPSDDKMICVMHTSNDFPAGPGQLFFHSKHAAELLNYLITRGKIQLKRNFSLVSSRRISRSEGDLCGQTGKEYTPDSPTCFRSHSGSDDSGVRVSVGSDDSGGYGLKTKNASSFTIAMGVLTKTPGGSETNEDSTPDLTVDQPLKCSLARAESGISLASGIYEEISDNHIKEGKKSPKNHIYEDPIELLRLQGNKSICDPPPLPRRNQLFFDSYEIMNKSVLSPKTHLDVYANCSYKQRCSTLPAKDLTRISQTFTAETEEYVVMSPKRKTVIQNLQESIYLPMSPAINLKTKIKSCLTKTDAKT